MQKIKKVGGDLKDWKKLCFWFWIKNVNNVYPYYLGVPVVCFASPVYYKHYYNKDYLK